METIFKKWVDKGVEKGIDKGKWDVVMNSMREGIPTEVIAKISGFTTAQISAFKEKMQDQQVKEAA